MRKFLFLIIVIAATSLQAQDFRLVRTFDGHASPVSYVTFRSEDNLMISGDEQGDIIVWNAENGSVLQRMTQHNGKITHLEFSNNGKLLASASYDGTIRIWNLDKFRTLQTFKNPATEAYDGVKGDEPTFVTFDPSDKAVYFGGYNLQVLRGTIRNGQIERIYTNDEFGITSGIIAPDKRHLVFGAGGSIFFMNLKTNRIVKQIHHSDNYDDYVCELAFMPQHSLLASWAVNGKLHFWNWQLEKRTYTLNATDIDGSSDVAFSEDGRFLVTGNFGDQTKLWNMKNRRVVQLLGAHSASVVTFAFSLDGNAIVTGSRDNTVKLWRKPTHEPIVENRDKIPNKVNGRKVEVQKVMNTKSRRVELMVWDNRKIDGDTISINVNGEWVLERHGLTDNEESVMVELNQKHNVIIIHAHNEGKIPPNTIAVIVKDGHNEEMFTLKSTMGTSAALKIDVEE